MTAVPIYRNSWIFWASSLAGATLAVCAHTDLLKRAFPALTPGVQGKIELAAFAVAWISAHAAWSPLPLKTDDGLLTAALPDVEPIKDPSRFLTRQATEH
jgi:hypothetical protein